MLSVKISLLPISFAVMLTASVIQPAYSHQGETCHPGQKLRIKRPAGGFAESEIPAKLPPFTVKDEFNGITERFFDNLCDPPMCLMVLCNGSCLYTKNPCRVSTHLKSQGAGCRLSLPVNNRLPTLQKLP